MRHRTPRSGGIRRAVPLVVAIALVAGVLGAPAVTPAAGADELEQKRAEAARVAERLDALESEATRLDALLERAKGELEEAEASLADAQRRADEARAELELRTRELRSYSVEAYVTGNGISSFDAVLRSEPDRAPQRRGYLAAAATDRQDLIDELGASRARAEAEGEALDAARARLEAEHTELSEQAAAAQEAVDEQTAIKERLDGEIAELVAAEQRRRAEEEARRAEAARAAAEAARPRAGTAPSGGGGGPAAPATRGGPSAPAPAPVDDTPPPPVGSGGAAAVAAAMSRIGMPYVWAAAGPTSFDCSGLTLWAWAQAGRSLPHYSGAQYAMSRRISAAEAQPGDLVFFWGPGEGGDPGHVGLYIGGGSFVHAPGRGKFVRVDSVGYWPGARVAYGRI